MVATVANNEHAHKIKGFIGNILYACRFIHRAHKEVNLTDTLDVAVLGTQLCRPVIAVKFSDCDNYLLYLKMI